MQHATNANSIFFFGLFASNKNCEWQSLCCVLFFSKTNTAQFFSGAFLLATKKKWVFYMWRLNSIVTSIETQKYTQKTTHTHTQKKGNWKKKMQESRNVTVLRNGEGKFGPVLVGLPGFTNREPNIFFFVFKFKYVAVKIKPAYYFF